MAIYITLGSTLWRWFSFAKNVTIDAQIEVEMLAKVETQAEASDKKALLYCKQQHEGETVRGGERAGEGTGEAGFRGAAELAGADNGTERGGRL